MAFKKTLAERLFNISRITNPALTTNCRTSSTRTAVRSAALNHRKTPHGLSPDPGDSGVYRRYLHRQSTATTPSGPRFLPTGEKLLEKLRGLDIARDRIKLDGLRPPAVSEESPEGEFTVADAKKILKFSQLDSIKSKLRQIEKDYVSYPEFLEICAKESSNDVDQALGFALMLDESGSVIVLGNIVFLRPEKVVKAVQELIPVQVNSKPDEDPRMKELQELENQKAAIDKKAKSSVRRELWFGLGFLAVQTAAFMRLTFWDLTWDVMEPICFYVTSIYFMGGYIFFLRTSKEPSFEGFFQSRFSSKQKRLMKAKNFDFERYQQLKKDCYPTSQESRVSFGSTSLEGIGKKF